MTAKPGRLLDKATAGEPTTEQRARETRTAIDALPFCARRECTITADCEHETRDVEQVIAAALRAEREQATRPVREFIVACRDHSSMEATPPWCRYVDHRQDMCSCDEIAEALEDRIRRALEAGAQEGKPE